MLVGEQYMLTSIVRETRDTILYRATQRELRREVIVEILRHSAMDSPRKVNMFLDSARAQAMAKERTLTRVLEVFEAEGTWLIAKDSPPGEPLDLMLSAGKRISALDMCQLLITLCKLCLRFDAEKVACTRFHLEDVFYHQHQFRLNNPARSGSRPAASSRSFLGEAARDLLPLLDSATWLAGTLASLMKRISQNMDDSVIKPALFLSELSRLYTLMLRPPEDPAPDTNPSAPEASDAS